MELVTVLATARGLDERGFLTTYTYRQIEHMASAYIKDRMFVVNVIASGLSSGKDGSDKKRGGAGRETQRRRSISPWLRKRMKPNAVVVDLDGPIEELAPFVHGIDKRMSADEQRKAADRVMKQAALEVSKRRGGR